MKFHLISVIITLASLMNAAEPFILVDAKHLPEKAENIEIKNGKLLFDGKSSCAELPKSETPASYTWTAWVKPEKKKGSSVIINKQGFHTTLKYTEWKVFFFSTYTDDRSLVTIHAPKLYEPGKWYFVSCGYDAEKNMIWIGINGEIVDDKVLKKPLLPNQGKYTVGGFPTGANKHIFSGEIGKIAVYNETIPETELEKMHEVEKGLWK